MRDPGPARWPVPVAVLALTYLVGAVFFPIVGFGFTDYDAPTQIRDNPDIRGLTRENLKNIFTSRGATSSYYPVRTLTYAIDYQLWGLNAGGFKLTNGLIHLVNVLLVFWLVLRLFRWPAASAGQCGHWQDVSVAAFSAGLFAVHPVVVEPVVWVPGREELLMTLGALGCFHFHLTARRLREAGVRMRRVLACHACAALFCALACLSNAVGAVIPALITAWDLLTLDRPKAWKVLCGTSALWVMGVATVVIKWLGGRDTELAGAARFFSAVIERFDYIMGIPAREPAALSIERLMVILNVYWLNLKTVVWPTRLAICHSKVRPQSFLDTQVILGGIAVGLTCLVLWKLRRHKLILFGLLWFGFALAPASQIIPHHVHRAERFLYLPLVGLVVATAIALRPLGNAVKGRAAAVGAIAVGVLSLLLLDTLSAHHLQTWGNSLSMWENCVKADPKNIQARMFAARHHVIAGQFQKAVEHYAAAMRLEPDTIDNLSKFASYLTTCEEEDLRDYELAVRVARQACELTRWEDPKQLRALAVVYRRFAESLADRREFEQAANNCNKAIAVAQAAGDTQLTGELQERLKRYQNHVRDGGKP